MKAKGTIKQISVREGEKNGRKWKNWSLKLDDGRYYSTFNEEFMSKLKEGDFIEFEYEEKEYIKKDGGKGIAKNIFIPKDTDILTQRVEVLEAKVKALEGKVVPGMNESEFEAHIKEVNKGEISGDDIDMSEIPF